MLRLITVQGKQIEPYLDALGALRITVFRDYPYLYDGSLDYERDYLKVYLEAERSLAVLAIHGDAVVGATTCMPMADEGPEFQEAFVKAGHDISRICYLGESILLPQYRGRGLGRQFFKHRENHARSLSLGLTTFCAVDRPQDHPLRPQDYRPLDDFWISQGYQKQPGMQATFHWKEVHEAAESAKTLTFWTKELK
ncbi:GNAT family N-acetyltransferase [Prosthecobacter algae]|uniref:GNAT family N-acetyltransferase n=1 Tax=Prosthecobacter algae TaxID=1144682 RepID=A0ABP9P299_9BACT